MGATSGASAWLPCAEATAALSDAVEEDDDADDGDEDESDGVMMDRAPWWPLR